MRSFELGEIFFLSPFVLIPAASPIRLLRRPRAAAKGANEAPL